MFIDARRIPEDTTVDADVCIVGAGAAGLTLALELAGLKHRVVLLESGDLEYDEATQLLYQGENLGLPYEDLKATRRRYFGGSSNCWGGWCRPLDDIDFEKRDWVRHSGWPVGRADLDPYYRRAHAQFGLGPFEYDTAFWQDRLEGDNLRIIPFDGGRVVTQISQLIAKPRMGEVFRRDIENASNVDTYLNANVVDIEVTDNAQEVTAVRVKTLSGNAFRVTAKVFVLATGGIENARLLLASNGVETAGLGNRYDLVGRFFMEHPNIPSGRMVLNDDRFPIDLYDVQYTFFNSRVAASLALSPETQRAEGLLNYKAWVVAIFKGEESEGTESLKRLYRAVRKSALPDHFMDTSGDFWVRNALSLCRHFGSVSVAAVGRKFRPRSLIDRYGFQHLTESEPDPDSRVTLASEKDALGVNRACLDWRMGPLTKRTLLRAQEIIGEELERQGLGLAEIELPAGDDVWPDDIQWGWHHMGTTRMSDDPKQGVVDRNCRVHGMANLYVAGSSVFPTGGNDLPTLTIVALAIRLADHLKAEVESARHAVVA